MSNTKPWVLIDLSFLAYRAMHTVGHLKFEGVQTGVMFGFFNQLRIICQDRQVNSNKIGIFCDSRKSFRKRFFKKYKEKRHKDRTPKEKAEVNLMWKQIHILVRDVLPAMGVPIYRQTGLESDDLLAQAAIQIRQKDERCIIVTADGDLYQCIRNAVHWFDPARRTYHNPQTFRAKKGIDARLWGEVKALAGCHSDNVPGISGIGEVTAIKYLTDVLPHHHASYRKIESAEGNTITVRNRNLVSLPHLRTKPVKLREPKYYAKAFFAACRKFGLLSFIKDKNRWLSFFQDKSRIIQPRFVED